MLVDPSGRELSSTRMMLEGCLRSWLSDGKVAKAMIQAGFDPGKAFQTYQLLPRMSEKALATNVLLMLGSKAVRRAVANQTAHKQERSGKVVLKDLLKLKRDLSEEYGG